MGWGSGMGLWSMPSLLHSLKIIIEIFLSCSHNSFQCMVELKIDGNKIEHFIESGATAGHDNASNFKRETK
jgi:hypothetical protein